MSASLSSLTVEMSAASSSLKTLENGRKVGVTYADRGFLGFQVVTAELLSDGKYHIAAGVDMPGGDSLSDTVRSFLDGMGIHEPDAQVWLNRVGLLEAARVLKPAWDTAMAEAINRALDQSDFNADAPAPAPTGGQPATIAELIGFLMAHTPLVRNAAGQLRAGPVSL